VRDFFRKNLGLKILSLLIAVSLEVYFMSPQNLIVETISASVELEGLPKDYMIVWPPSADEGMFVACKLRGPGPIVQELRTSPRKFKVRFPAKPPKIMVVNLNPEELKLPSGVDLLEIQPGKVEFRIELVTERTLPVEAKFSGEIPNGFRMESYKIEPSEVAINGPESELEGIEQLETEELDLSQFRNNSVIDVPLKELGGKLSLRRKAVRIMLNLGPIQSDRVFPGVKVSVRAPDGYAASVTPSRVKAIFTGDEKSISSLEESELEVVATIPEPARPAGGKRFVEQVKLEARKLPAGVRLLSTEPAQVEVTLVRRQR